ncbi:hypothetical protein [Mycobacterium deserti]|uniref:Transmembrane protein n=1 Tax=Mycobacterium deserti TaxID=2978347 RepID=A0ABT2MH96_9MYCO|nr:hypothetical protein [Mycobacterium deserti]MCT7661668.1 hypothetical protein [Mycobacterium deserti]
MSRTVAVIWHASFCIVAGVLYFFFVMPRMPELLGDTSHTLGTALRIVVGALIGLAAIPVALTLQRTRKPELGVPQLALTLRMWSIVLHVLAAVLIIAAAISEIWLSLDSAGQWLFGIYGAAAAIALLGLFAFYLAFVAEMPPPPPKALKPKTEKQRRGRRKGAAADTAADEPQGADDPSADSPAESAKPAEPADDDEDSTTEVSEPESTAVEPQSTAEEAGVDETPAPEAAGEAAADDADGGLRNRRPSGKTEPTRRRRRRLRGGVAVED